MNKQNERAAALGDWVHDTAGIPASGLQRTREASAEERDIVAQSLDLAALDKLQAEYRINSIAGGGWRLSGRIQADVVQRCVVTLEPVPGTVEGQFAVEFWRDLEEPEGGEDKSVLQGADTEILEADAIPAGRIVFETLSAALDPYPRKEGAAFDWEDTAAVGAEKSNPFSILARLKDKS